MTEFEEIVRSHYFREGVKAAARECERIKSSYDPYSGLLDEEDKIRYKVIRDVLDKVSLLF